MIKGKTASGFNFKIDEEARDDMELLELLTDMDRGETSQAPKVVEMLLGAEQKKALYEHCRGKSGRVSATRVFEELTAIFNEIGKTDSDTKN